MSMAFILIKRNIKLFFKDKGMFFTSLITPAILLVLYVTFLGNVYRDSFTSNLPDSLKLSEDIIEGLVGGQLISSILAVSCVTVAFCSNFLMVQDKANGTIRDLRISPVKAATLSLSYYVATLFSTLIICFVATGICLAYVAIVGWYMSLSDIFFLFLDILLLVLFGTALSSIINLFLSTQGQISAVGTIISAGYGFICGAYMPISSFSEGLQKLISFLPGTYGTSLIRNHTMQGVFAEMQNQGIPTEVVEKLKDSIDCNVYFFGSQVNIGAMYMILGITILVLIGSYILLNKARAGKATLVKGSGAQKYSRQSFNCGLTTNYTHVLKGANAKAKANAVQGLPELIEIADGKKFTENYKEKHTIDAMYGWYRYESRFALPVFDEVGEIERYNVFNVIMVIRHAKDGKMYLYDIMNIKKETSTLFQSEDITQ